MNNPTIIQALQAPLPNPSMIMAALRAAGLPLASGQEEDEAGASAGSEIVCIAAVTDDNIHALVATPSGLVYRFEPDDLDAAFWKFSGSNYYWVTGNMADRQKAADLAGIDIKQIKGRCLNNKKITEISGLGLDEVLEQLGYAPKAPAPEARPAQSGFGF